MAPDLSTPLLVLWDIDHTLLVAGTVSRDAYAAAFRRATGRRLELVWQFAGRTEQAAATEVLRAHGLDPGDGLLETFLDLIVEEFGNRVDDLAASGRVLLGAAQALTTVGAVPGVRQSVLTGNLYPLAVLKLTALDLASHVDLRLGAYGGDAYERTDLPAYAFARTAQHLGWQPTGADTVIIGDTPRDIAAARAVGARAVAVATGTVSVAELAAAGPDALLPDLADTAAVVEAVTGSRAAATQPLAPAEAAEQAGR